MWTQATKEGVHGKSKGHVDSHMQPKENARQLKVEAMQQKVERL